MSEVRNERIGAIRRFLRGGPQTMPFVALDPSSFAAVLAGREGGSPTVEDEIRFHQAFPNDALVHVVPRYSEVVPELRWDRKPIRTDPDGSLFSEETLRAGRRTWRRVIADRPGTTPWLAEPAVKSVEDFDLLDFQADTIRRHAPQIARSYAKYPPMLLAEGMLPATVILTAFEAYWLIDYPDMPLFFMDWPDRYLAAIENIHAANLAMLEAMAGVGYELVCTGSAGLELLSPAIFERAIVPFQREFNDRARELGVFSSYHICGHSRHLVETGVIDRIKPTIFETCSTPPCGDNATLAGAVRGVSDEIVTKGNLALETLLRATPDQIRAETLRIMDATRDRRHIIGQADATIITGTPTENIEALVETGMGTDQYRRMKDSVREANGEDLHSV